MAMQLTADQSRTCTVDTLLHTWVWKVHEVRQNEVYVVGHRRDKAGSAKNSGN